MTRGALEGASDTSALRSVMFELEWPPGSGRMQVFPEVDRAEFFEASVAVAYAFVVAFLEPFYVAAGFAMYLNRRAELEAWDVEQELRRAFGS